MSDHDLVVRGGTVHDGTRSAWPYRRCRGLGRPGGRSREGGWPEVRYDLPAGERRLLQRADGYRHTFVNGTEIYRDGEPTGELPGRPVRGSRPAPTH